MLNKTYVTGLGVWRHKLNGKLLGKVRNSNHFRTQSTTTYVLEIYPMKADDQGWHAQVRGGQLYDECYRARLRYRMVPEDESESENKLYQLEQRKEILKGKCYF